ncbi:hypothetical protein V6R86_01830 [Sphingomonas kaistensis]|uniref:Uncharacterized protein n=1 Tax=Sphingomonas kaistensis TaxID=298708 RepID=A0ABZ2FZA9_9SPHN
MSNLGPEGRTAAEFVADLETIRGGAARLIGADRNTILVESQTTAENITTIAERLINAIPNLKQDLPDHDIERIVAEMRTRKRARVAFTGDPVFADITEGSEMDCNEAVAVALLEIRDQVVEGVNQLSRIAAALESIISSKL